MRAIVHKTKGKLDLRALTVFGMNAKPETSTPIGYFGTGLKYAIAVLSRHNIPVTIWIDGKKWDVVREQDVFRSKEFITLQLRWQRTTLFPNKFLKLPFTTELGKNWEIWQAFRELEANTRDEKGETLVCEPIDLRNDEVKGFTCIQVEDERYVQCWLDRDNVFLPEGLSVRASSDRVQAFARKSKHVYYRGIRILDLKEESQNTYNILSQLELTEDRTAKSQFSVDYEVEQFLVQTKDREVLDRAIRAPEKSYEHGLDFEYTTPSTQFLETVSNAGSYATPLARSALRRARPPAKVRETYTNWIRAFIGAIERGDYDAVEEIAAGAHRDELLAILRTVAGEFEREQVNNQLDTPAPRPEVTNNDGFDDCPF